MNADTSHIEACRKAWITHEMECDKCKNAIFPSSFCQTGQVLHDEYRSAITANRDCEQVEAKAVE